MKLIVGLGNPGSKYNFTRHNLGFLALDYYLKVHKLTWNTKPRLGALYCRTDDAIFIKPQEFYNDSGKVVREYLRYHKVALSDVVVICDDFNLEFGKLRFRQTGADGGNNGLKSIISEIGTNNFARLRVGTGNDELHPRMGDVDFVLSKFTPEEKSLLPEILDNVDKKITEVIGWI